ncbi:MAG: sigma 54-interacting transcriptional regulator [Myxococcales bacterium]|nr:sigma 54-interacting transcriptional regulator [Myxococcales bacterium]
MRPPDTLDASDIIDEARAEGRDAIPGLALIFAGGQPTAAVIPFVDGAVELGREHPAFAAHPDPRISRRHVTVRFDGRRFVATDLGSRNGAAVDGEPLPSNTPRELSRVLRIGDSLLLPRADLGPLQSLGVRVVDGRIEGPATQAALQAVAHAARLGATLHITGESGAGKEGLARAFHDAGPGSTGNFEAVNCATIPEGVAERLLFGTRRGAYSGADAHADGYVQAADGGTLFLDEVAELSLAVQAKLLRVLETREVLPLGAARPHKVDLRFCSATHRDLRAQVAAGRLREDLFFRIATPQVKAPPLRDRPEEIPWLLRTAIAGTAKELATHVSLVETCLLRAWPGNVRELLAEARSAAQAAVAAGSSRVEARHLSERAGSVFAPPPAPQPEPSARPTTATAPPTRARLVAALKRCQGNVSAAARELGVHRTQLRRWLERHALDARGFAASAAQSQDESD